MIFRTDVFPDGLIIVRIKSNDENAPLTKIIYEPNGNLPSSEHPQALAIAKILWNDTIPPAQPEELNATLVRQE
jgi:hypothetical protein